MQRYQEQRQALGSIVFLTIVTTDVQDVSELFATLWQKIAEFEKRFSRFLPASELTAFNHTAGTKTVVSLPFLALLKAAKTMQEQTSGLFNPFILPSLQKAGYVGSWPTPALAHQSTVYLDATPTGQIELGRDWARIPANTALDFGGIGKGYLLDELGDYLDHQALAGYSLSLGGDILCAGSDVTGKPWQVGIAQADDTQAIAASMAPAKPIRFAVATSGITKRHGETWHHIIDPRTQQPATTDLTTVSVRATSAMLADVWAKCLVIVGSKQAPVLAASAPIDGALLQTKAATLIKIGAL